MAMIKGENNEHYYIIHNTHERFSLFFFLCVCVWECPTQVFECFVLPSLSFATLWNSSPTSSKMEIPLFALWGSLIITLLCQQVTNDPRALYCIHHPYRCKDIVFMYVLLYKKPFTCANKVRLQLFHYLSTFWVHKVANSMVHWNILSHISYMC